MTISEPTGMQDSFNVLDLQTAAIGSSSRYSLGDEVLAL